MQLEVATLRRALVALTVQLFPTPWPQPPDPGAWRPCPLKPVGGCRRCHLCALDMAGCFASR